MHEGPKAGGSMEFKETENKLEGLECKECGRAK